ncbi:MAG: malto-oligosyltrehalose synthase [Candidatus Ancillula sp.]|nr:malto-oligosyltrehalose synthase [Candidatus Ancillula sp.]
MSKSEQHVFPENRIPQPGFSIPSSTYRIQLNSNFNFDDCIEIVPYLEELGVSHLYLSPILQATPGSKHGYDVINHSKISDDLGGIDKFLKLSKIVKQHKMGIIVDIVPNHMAIPKETWLNLQLWDVLLFGAESKYKHWFDIDFSRDDPRIVLPILEDPIIDSVEKFRVEIANFNGEDLHVLKYNEFVFPLRDGTYNLPIEELLEQQNYKLAYWKSSNDSINYRRFFDIQALIALKMDNWDVFYSTHKLIINLVKDGIIDGLRIDHPDGLANPKMYLDWINSSTGGCWNVVEKILRPTELIEEDWKTCGTTGYKSMNMIYHSLLNPYGQGVLRQIAYSAAEQQVGLKNVIQPLDTAMLGNFDINSLSDVMFNSKRQVIRSVLYPDFVRLLHDVLQIINLDLRFQDFSERNVEVCLESLLLNFPNYRPYISLGKRISTAVFNALEETKTRSLKSIHSDLSSTLDFIFDLLVASNDLDDCAVGGVKSKNQELAKYIFERSQSDERFARLRQRFINNFSQILSSISAKGIEDTFYYRFSPLVSLMEIGGDPYIYSRSIQTFHNFCTDVQLNSPYTMTSLSTHDSKRSEDVRAILLVISENVDRWEALLSRVRSVSNQFRTPYIDQNIENHIWQIILGTWRFSDDGGEPIEFTRLEKYLIKVMREAKIFTTWNYVHTVYEAEMITFFQKCLNDECIIDLFKSFVKDNYRFIRSAILTQKALQLLMPGVPDLYQGSELVLQTLVDPDNRRNIDYTDRIKRLGDVQENVFSDLSNSLHNEKMLITHLALKMRKVHYNAFSSASSSYQPLPSSTDCCLGFSRLENGNQRVVCLVERYSGSLERHAAWSDHTVSLPSNNNESILWHNVLTDEYFKPGNVKLSRIFAQYPVAILEYVHQKTKKNYLEVWAPFAKNVTCSVAKPKSYANTMDWQSIKSTVKFKTVKMRQIPDKKGWWRTKSAVPSKCDYFFNVDQNEQLPDPRSKMQPFGVNGLSRNIILDDYTFDDTSWFGNDVKGSVIYELHIGTFTEEGTFGAAMKKLEYLKELGVDIIEILPVSVFDGKFGWGYDGVDIYAVNQEYGGPVEFKRFVNKAHNLQIAVCLDVVYNHLGPTGNYLNKFAPYYTDKHITYWGPGFNFDGDESEGVRQWVLDYAKRCINEFKIDHLRIDATHAIHDDSNHHILADLSALATNESFKSGRKHTLIAESDANQIDLLASVENNGKGFETVWADDFHHALFSFITGQRNGYYQDFGDIEQLGKALKQGWVYDGAESKFRNGIHGTPVPDDFDLRRFVVYYSNHDQIGNRPFGDRPSSSLRKDQIKQMSALTILSPFTPMLFMGEEFSASSPFQFFADYTDDSVREACKRGRREEFAGFYSGLVDGDKHLPDPLAVETFNNSKLHWDELQDGVHQEMLLWHKELIKIRKQFIGKEPTTKREVNVRYIKDNGSCVLSYEHSYLAVLCNFLDFEAEIGVVGQEDVHPEILLQSEKNRLFANGVLRMAPRSVTVLKY